MKGSMENSSQDDIGNTAEELALAGNWKTALALLMEAYGRSPSAALERQMVDMRIRACRDMDCPTPDLPWPPPHSHLEANSSDLPELNPEALNRDTLRSGILGNGGLIVRGLMPRNIVDEMRGSIDRVLHVRNGGETSPEDAASLYSRSAQVKGGPTQFFALGDKSLSESASVWAVDSPQMASRIIQFYESIGLPELLHEYFSEPAVLSVKKWVLRRVAPENGGQAGWHQDGQFLGDDIRTVNLWVALTECGGDADAPGMEIVAGENNKIYETGSHGAPFDWTVGQGLVDEISQKSPVLCPRFSPGDALFFDHYNLHRTGFGNNHSQARYAIESWFFAASRAPVKQIPVLL
jgi:hypothetical protein